MNMKKIVFISLVVISLSLAACGRNGGGSEVATPVVTPESTPDVIPESTPEPIETDKPIEPVNLSIDAEDATPYNTKDNAVPLGQWVYYQSKNFTSGEKEPFYIRIINVSRDEAEIQTAIDSFGGNRDFSLSEDQARDIEYGMVEYEIYFAPDYASPERGISIPSTSMSATPIETVGFKTAGGMSYIGVGRTYELQINGSSFRAQPGEIVREKSLFTVLKNYDESEYVFRISWYDGEIATENARDLFLAAK